MHELNINYPQLKQKKIYDKNTLIRIYIIRANKFFQNSGNNLFSMCRMK